MALSSNSGVHLHGNFAGKAHESQACKGLAPHHSYLLVSANSHVSTQRLVQGVPQQHLASQLLVLVRCSRKHPPHAHRQPLQ